MNDLFDLMTKEKCDICQAVDEVAGRTLNKRAICPGCLAMMYAGSIHYRTDISSQRKVA